MKSNMPVLSSRRTYLLRRWGVVVLVSMALFVVGCSRSKVTDMPAGTPAVPASCGRGSLPELGLQGQVPLADRQNGRSQQGYRCNLEIVGQYQGEGASWVNPSMADCAYMETSFLGLATKPSPGVQVVDVSDPANPLLSANLISPAMLIGPWEALKVNPARQLLGAATGGPIIAAAYFDVYDISGDCAHPKLLNGLAGTPLELPDNLLGHEGNWSPDGRTYWATGMLGGTITAIDVSNPATPSIIYTGLAGFPGNHGAEFSADGKRLYLATASPAGVLILDVSDIQDRVAAPTIRQIGQVTWDASGNTQQALPVSYRGKPYLIAADEFDSQGVHFVDISDETQPKVVKQLQLEIQLPQHSAIRTADTASDGIFGYEAHYCSVDRQDNPTALACGFFQSGIRVFDIRNPQAPREVAYFNPPAQVGKATQLLGSEHAAGFGLLPQAADTSNVLIGASDYAINLATRSTADLTADWCSSPPRFVAPDQLWVTCQDNGFMVLRFTNGAYPLQ